MSRRPRVITRCVAQGYAGPGERIVEFSFPGTHAGGLISLRVTGDGQPVVDVYRVTGCDVRVQRDDTNPRSTT